LAGRWTVLLRGPEPHHWKEWFRKWPTSLLHSKCEDDRLNVRRYDHKTRGERLVLFRLKLHRKAMLLW
jgi:hypothetical protein